ncbi:MAG TPA: amino acid permease [Symbiobacteriaceae bacterium]
MTYRKRGVSGVHKGHSAKLSVPQLTLLALGSAVGGSFFLSTAVGLRTTGPGVLLAFGLGGFLVYIILMALSEMTTAHPSHGSFREYAEMAFGPMASFVVGWLYWAGMVLALSSEAVAVALFARLWAPTVPVWIFSGIVVVGVTLVNLLDVSLFSLVESVMASAKLLAIVAFVLLMLAVITGLMPGRAPVGLGAARGEPLLPSGVGGLAGTMLTVLFAYAGFEVLGLAAPEAVDPKRTVRKAILLTVISLVVLYVGAMAVILPVLPIGSISPEVSPMVTALRTNGFHGLAGVLNVVIMSASISTMLAAMYALSRMLYSLAEEGQAPAFLRALTPVGAPRRALLFSGGAMLVGVVLAYLLPKQVYLFLISAGGFSLIFAYVMILASQLVIRRREGCRLAACQLPGYPYITWLGIILLVAVIAAMPLVPGQGAGLAAGLGLLAVIAAAYALRTRRPAAGPGPGPGPEPVDKPAEQRDDRLLLR